MSKLNGRTSSSTSTAAPVSARPERRANLSTQSESESQEDGTTLCLACGLCCTGMLHRRALLQPVELEMADQLGLTVLVNEEPLCFRLPCPRFEHGRCAVYPYRPKVCGDYRCKLLRSLKNQEIELESALQQVEQVKTLLAEVEEMLGDEDSSFSIWERMKRFAADQELEDDIEFGQAYPMLKLKLGLLSLFCNRYFYDSEEGITNLA